MKIAFTLCSNNYLAQAITLGQSLKNTNKEFHFFIGLIDQLNSSLNYDEVRAVATILPLQDIIEHKLLTDLVNKYDIIELNTSVKPSYFKYFIHQFPDLERIYYLDPDIEVFHSFDTLDQQLLNASILLSPHFLSPIPLDNKLPQENLATNYGMYNLGFLGLNPKHQASLSMLDWWEERCLTNCFINEPAGIFVDQLFMNHVPIFFKEVKILEEKGINMAPWNLHERKLVEIKNGAYKLEHNEVLIFYHFSSYQFSNPSRISKYYNRYTFDDLPVLGELYSAYHQKVMDNGYDLFSKATCFYNKALKKTVKQKIKFRIKNILKLIKA